MFIAFEGLDGSGSSTQAKLLENALRQQEKEVVLTKEPTNNVIGGLIRGVLTHEWSLPMEGFQLLFAADRSHHLAREIEPCLADGKIVITDRYILSTLAFGAIDIDDPQWLYSLNSKFRWPDITFLLKVRPEVCMQRIMGSRPSTEFYEKEEKLRKVWENYEKLAGQYENIYIIDGEQSIDEIHKEVLERVGDGK